MKALEQLERLKRMNCLIKNESTGTPKEFANKLRISESHLYRCIEEIKDMGAPVNFNRRCNTYYYEDNFELTVSYSIRVVSENQSKTIVGGLGIKNGPLLFFESGWL